MEWLTGNSFFVLLLLVCVGMHLFGHGHGHKHGQHSDDDANMANHNDVGHDRREI